METKATSWLNGPTAAESEEEDEEFTTGEFGDVAMEFAMDESEIEDGA
jgi:hypothetical protein